MSVGAVQYQSVQSFTQAQAAAPAPAVAAFEARNSSVGAAQTEAAVRAPDHTNRNQEARETRREYRAEHKPNPPREDRGRNVDITV